MGAAFSSDQRHDGGHPWIPQDSAEQILYRCKYLTDEWDTVMREHIVPQRVECGGKQSTPDEYDVPVLCFIPRMISDFPKYKGFAPPSPVFEVRRVTDSSGTIVREKRFVDDDGGGDDDAIWEPLVAEEEDMLDTYEEYFDLVDTIRKQQSYNDGVHERPTIRMPGELVDRVVDFYRRTYIENSEKLQELSRTYLMSEWRAQRRAG